MITIRSSLHVEGLSGREVYDFLIDPSDQKYQAWWSGTHLQLHLLERGANHIGDVVYMDEWIGQYRTKGAAVVVEAVPGKKIVWQVLRRIRLPAWFTLEFEDDEHGVTITHTIEAGFKGIGRILDPLLNAYLSPGFRRALEEHVRAEFPKLRDLLHGQA